MADEDLDALLICAHGASGRGRIRYVSDVYLWGGQTFVILPRNQSPVMIQPAYVGSGWAESVGWIKDNRAAVDPGRGAAEVLREMGMSRAAIGVVGLGSDIAPRDVRTIESVLPTAMLHDATLTFDMVRIVKSEEEIGHLRSMSAVLLRAYEALEQVLKPGVTEREVIAQAIHEAYLYGCLDGFAHISRSGGLHVQHPPTNDIIWESDSMTVDLEYIGPEGYALELARCYSFHPPPDAARRVYDVQVEVFARCMEVMQPGNSSYRIFEAADAAYRQRGFYAAGPSGHGPVQLHAHGIGLGFDEPPGVPGLDIMLRPGMVVCLHPHLGPEDPMLPDISIEDTILITEHGPERLTDQQDRWRVL